MDDQPQKVQCSDCKSIVNYSFVLAANDGQQTALMLLAACPRCQQKGDKRSLRNFVKVDKTVMEDALLHGMCMVLLR